VTPQPQKDEDSTIVRPSGFTPSLSSMDVPREGVAAKKRKRRILIISASAVGLILATFALSRLKPAAPSVPVKKTRLVIKFPRAGPTDASSKTDISRILEVSRGGGQHTKA